MRFVLLFGLVLSTLLAASPVFAGGGGCDDGPCVEPPRDLLGECRLKSIKSIDSNAVEVGGASTLRLLDNIRNNGLRVELRGDAKAIHSSLVSLHSERASVLGTYRGQDPISLATGEFRTTQYNQFRSSANMNDPRPRVMYYLVEISNRPDRELARMRILQGGYFDPKDPWENSTQLVLSGLMECRIRSTPRPAKP